MLPPTALSKQMSTLSAVLFLVASLSITPLGFSQQYNPYAQPYSQPTYSNTQSMQPLQGYVVTVPAGSIAQATIQSPVSSYTARAGDRFNVNLAGPLMAGNSVALPSGTLVEGQVISAMAAGRAGRNGQLDIRFTSAILPNGQRVPLSARLQTTDGSGVLKGGTGMGRAGGAAARAAGGAALGAALGTAMGPLSGGSVGRGAIYGTILGSGLGAVAAGVNKGEDVSLNPGSPITLTLDAPMTTSADSSMGAYTQAAPQAQYGQPQYTQPYGSAPAANPYQY